MNRRAEIREKEKRNRDIGGGEIVKKGIRSERIR